jgi:antitoxin component of MazEF toxin-antitoxin module
MVEWTKVIAAHKKTPSCRVTIPLSVVKLLDLHDGDEIGWLITAKSEGVLGVELMFKKKENKK